MTRSTRLALAALLLSTPAIVSAQAAPYPTIASGKAAGTVTLQCDGSFKNCAPVTPYLPMWTAGKQELFLLATGNVAGSDQSNTSPAGGGSFVGAATSTVLGGSYALTQICTGYGTAAVQVLYAPTSTWLTIGSYSAPDTTSHVLQLGSNAQVRMLLTGTTACTANLSRIPA